MLFLSLILYLFCAVVHAAEHVEHNKDAQTFLKQVKSVSVSDSESEFDFFRMNVDLRHFDFYGNEQTWRPDRTLSIDSAFCIEYGNTNVNFRKFAGLLLGELSEMATEKWWLTNWSFKRVNEIGAAYYPMKSNGITTEDTTDSKGDSPLDQSLDKPGDQDPLVFLPRLKASDEHASVLMDFVIDLFRVFLPNLQGSQLEHTSDIAGMVIFLALKLIDDLEGYFDEVKGLYAIMKDLAFSSFDLKQLETADKFSGIDRQKLLEELFRVALVNDLLYTLELFYALEMVEMSGELLKFVLKTSICPAVLNRFFDFVDWKGLVHVPEMCSGSPVSRLHYLYESYPEYLKMLYEYESMRIDWSIAEIPDKANSQTILGKLLGSLSEPNSIFDGQLVDKSHSRFLLRELLGQVAVPQLISRAPDRDLLEECLENDRNGLKQLVEYFDVLPVNQIDGVLAEYLKRIIITWGAGELPYVKVFKFMVKRRTGGCDSVVLPVLNEAYELISSWTPKASRSVSPRNLSPRSLSSRSISFSHRSISGEIFRSIFGDTTSSSSEIVSSSPSPSPICRASVEMLKMIVMEGETISSCGNSELFAVWSSRFADLEAI